jgi:hypothetical protein
LLLVAAVAVMHKLVEAVRVDCLLDMQELHLVHLIQSLLVLVGQEIRVPLVLTGKILFLVP